MTVFFASSGERTSNIILILASSQGASCPQSAPLSATMIDSAWWPSRTLSGDWRSNRPAPFTRPCHHCGRPYEYPDEGDWGGVSQIVNQHWYACPESIRCVTTSIRISHTAGEFRRDTWKGSRKPVRAGLPRHRLKLRNPTLAVRQWHQELVGANSVIANAICLRPAYQGRQIEDPVHSTCGLKIAVQILSPEIWDQV